MYTAPTKKRLSKKNLHFSFSGTKREVHGPIYEPQSILTHYTIGMYVRYPTLFFAYLYRSFL